MATRSKTTGGKVWVRYYKDRKGEWRWSIRSKSNGLRLASSSEGYKRLDACEKALRTIATHLPSAVAGQ